MTQPSSAIRAIAIIFGLAIFPIAINVSAQAPAHPSPYPGRPGSDGPGQGEIATIPSDTPAAIAASTDTPVASAASTDASIARVLLADLALTRSFKLSSINIPWGESGEVLATNAVSKTMGKCVFRYRYSTRNQGQMAASPATNRIFLGTQNGSVLASATLPALAKNAQASSIGEVALKPGVSMLYVRVDAANQVNESDESNNLRRVRVTVQGDCIGQ
jgi:CARDB